MKHNVVAPRVGESITEVSILKWTKSSGQAVKKGELILEIESDKATVEIIAEASGVLTTLKNAGDRIPVGEVIGVIDETGTAPVAQSAGASAAPAAPAKSAQPSSAPPSPAAPVGAG